MHPGAVDLIKVAERAVLRVRVRDDGTATERWLQRRIEGRWTVPDPGDTQASVEFLPTGDIQIDVKSYRLRASPTKVAGRLSGTETGPYGDSPFEVFIVSRKVVDIGDFHTMIWLFVREGHRPTIIEFPVNTSGYTVAGDVFGTQPFGVGRLDLANMTDGVLRLEFSILWDRPKGRTRVYKVRSSDGSNVLRGTSCALYPVAAPTL